MNVRCSLHRPSQIPKLPGSLPPMIHRFTTTYQQSPSYLIRVQFSLALFHPTSTFFEMSLPTGQVKKLVTPRF